MVAAPPITVPAMPPAITATPEDRPARLKPSAVLAPRPARRPRKRATATVPTRNTRWERDNDMKNPQRGDAGAPARRTDAAPDSMAREPRAFQSPFSPAAPPRRAAA